MRHDTSGCNYSSPEDIFYLLSVLKLVGSGGWKVLGMRLTLYILNINKTLIRNLEKLQTRFFCIDN